jgi:lipid-A-disaccharide synthase
MKKVLVIAGEASADLHAYHLLETMAQREPLELVGIGGDWLEKLGLKPIKHARDMAVVGLTEAVRKIPQTLRLFNELEALAKQEKPDFVLMLDLPDFNLRLAPRFKKLGIPVVYYISPQVWAWRSSRVKKMAKALDLLLLILPFEEAWYKDRAPLGFQVDYVGHPVTEEIPDLPYAPEPDLIALMPGSRESEWRNIAQPMLEAAALLHRGNPRLRFQLPLASTLRKSPVAQEILSADGPAAESLRSLGSSFEVVNTAAHETLRRARVACIASGTATLEAAVVGTPMVVAYKVSAGTAFLFQHVVRYRGPVAIVNIIHGGLGTPERVVPELLQDDVTGPGLASALRQVMADPVWSIQREKLAQTRPLLQGPGMPVANAAAAIEKFLAGRE